MENVVRRRRIMFRARIGTSRFWFFVCLFVIVVGTICAVAVLNAGRNSFAISNSFDGETEDEIFANFRKVKVGRLKNGILFRSASPVDNSHNRAAVVDRLVGDAGIRYAVNLSDNENSLNSHISEEDFDSANYLSLYESGDVVLLHMDMKYKEKKFGEKLVRGLIAMTEHEGPYLIHCVEGKDRTGYVMMMLEALMGASYEEMVNDYMVTYDNYYEVNRESNLEKYEEIKKKNIDAMLYYIIGDEKTDLASVSDYSGYAKDYLKSIGMSGENVERLEHRLEG